MKTHRKLLPAFALAIAFSLLPALRAGPDALRVAPDNAREHVADKLTGQKIFAQNGEALGTIKDFVIASPKGSPVYAVITAGGMLGMGDTLRLVPVQALNAQVARGADGFSVALDAARWHQLAPIDHESYDRGFLRLTADQHSQLATPFRSQDGFNDVRLDNDAQLIRASDLRRKEIHAGAEEVGQIEGVVIDLRASRADVLLETEDDFAGRETLVLVPMNRLTFTSSKNDRIITSLTREDFTQLHASVPARTAAVDTPQPRKPAVISDGGLAPTGRLEAEPQSQEELLEIGARSVRDILKAEPRFREADIDVEADYGRIVLSGHAASEELREDIHDTAKGATGLPVLNNIVVKPDRD